MKDSKAPELDYNQMDTFLCGSLIQEFKIAFSNGQPAIILKPLDSRVSVVDENTYSPTITVPEFGTYPFQLDMIAQSGCEYIDTIHLG
ncbi:MAG TPA: hypothetical protein PLG58_06520, partial [Flexilinea sp.]|nr:hypothetical protein [Flexilinea sp.]